MKIGIVSLGCPKNLTDTEVIMGKLASAGHQIVSDEKKADVLIINTCAFIKPAADEALQEIRRAVRLKDKGVVKYVIVAGCLPQRGKFQIPNPNFQTNHKSQIPNGVDAVVGAGSIDKIMEVVKNLENSPRSSVPVPQSPSQRSCLFNSETPRIKATPRHYAYIKIADGCNNRCTYCTVPSIRGPYKSRPIEDIVKEAKGLAKSGCRELILVAQDTTYYGKDLYGKFALPSLLKKLCGVKGLKWIRIMYTHPAHITGRLIKVIANEKKIVKYIDLPLQHICDSILQKMGRRTGRREIIALMAKIRRSVPGIAIRTTFIVGFPGEKGKEFKEFLDFIKKERFQRLGIFTYFAEPGTPAALLRGQVPEGVKKDRFHNAMRLQNKISGDLNEGKINTVIDVLVDKIEKGSIIGRSCMDAPDIDGSVFIAPPPGGAKGIVPGDFVRARVVGATAYDLFGRLVT